MKDIGCADSNPASAFEAGVANMPMPAIPEEMMSSGRDATHSMSNFDFQDNTAQSDDEASDEIARTDRSRCVHSAVRILAGREHSKVELKRKLLSRSFEAMLVETTLVQLADDGLQSDARFTESFVRSRINRGQGPVRIRMELLERGISDAMAAPHLDMGSTYWLKIAREIRQRRFGDVPESSDQSWNRQARFLSQRGFPSDVVMRALGA